MSGRVEQSDFPPLPIIIFAIGQALLLLLVPGRVNFTLPLDSGLLLVFGAEAVLFGVLLLSLLRESPRLRAGFSFLLFAGLLCGLVLVGLRFVEKIWFVSGLLVVVVGFLSYTLHRVEAARIEQLEVGRE